MVDTMRAAVLSTSGPVEDPQIRDLPVPAPASSGVRIPVMAPG